METQNEKRDLTSTASVKYATFAKVIDVRERTIKKWKCGVKDDAQFVEQNLGYYALFEGSFEAIHLGMEPPALQVGDTVKITFEKVTPPCPPSPDTNPQNS